MFEKALDEWEELSSSSQTWDEFQAHFQDTEENFNINKNIHDKKGGVGQANLVLEEDNFIPYEDQQFDTNKMDSYLDNLDAAATQDKDVLEKLVNNNANLITQLASLSNKFEQLSSQEKSSITRIVPMSNAKKMTLIQNEKNGYCHTHSYRCVKNNSSRKCSKPGPK